MAPHEIPEETSRNFHLFYDNFPFPAILVHKDRTILDRNRKAEEVGYPLGTRCIDMGEKEHHKICLANQALRGGNATRLVAYIDFTGMVMDTYWIPLAGSDEYFVHYAADISEWASERLLPKRGEVPPAT